MVADLMTQSLYKGTPGFTGALMSLPVWSIKSAHYSFAPIRLLLSPRREVNFESHL